MNTTFIAMGVSILLGIGLLVGLGALSLLSGALNFLFVKPHLKFLKSQYGDNGFAFTFEWDQDAEDVKFDTLRIQLFNPFGTPTQMDIMKEFEGSKNDFARDIELGAKFSELIAVKTIDKATVEITVSASNDQTFHTISYKGAQFIKLLQEAKLTHAEVSDQYKIEKIVPLFSIPEKSFISPPLPKSAKALKLATNPEFAGQFAGSDAGAGTGGAAVANFSVSKVWIEPGCIVCDACEAIFPEVFEVTDSTCVIRPGAPLDDGLKIQESAEACPVEVIKYTKVG